MNLYTIYARQISTGEVISLTTPEQYGPSIARALEASDEYTDVRLVASTPQEVAFQ